MSINYQRIRFLCLAACSIYNLSYCYALINGKYGKIDFVGSAILEYDSRVFGISSSSFEGAKISASPFINSDNLKSEDDFIVRFTPALHFSKKLKWFSIGGTAGLEIAQYLKNKDISYTNPITNLFIDFDETLSKNKRVSNNSKIRFDATFDIGQQVGASVLEQDLTSYTFFDAGFNVRYNHSPKFGVGAGTSYNVKYYQTGSTSERPYQDLSTLPISAKAFYIYSEKLDFYSDYTFSRSNDNQSGSDTLSDSSSHSFSLGIQGDYSSKLSGDSSIGYSLQRFENELVSNQSNIIASTGIEWVLNVKSSIGFDLHRSFSPSAQGFSTFGTNAKFSLNHRLTEDISAIGYISAGNSEYTYPKVGTTSRDSSKLKFYGLGISMKKSISKSVSLSGAYDFSYFKRNDENYGRHLINTALLGRF